MTDIFDFAIKSDTEKTILKNPNTQEPLLHEETEMFIERYLPHTAEYKRSQYSHMQKYVKDGGVEFDPKTADLYEMEKDRIEVLAETVSSWAVFYNGEWLPYTKESAVELFNKAPWIVDQLNKAEESIVGFTKA